MEAERQALIAHLKGNALRTDGPFQLASGAISDWYLDGRQTTFDGAGARLVARAVDAALVEEVTAVGGMTMGADPIAVSTVVVSQRRLTAFSVRKTEKDHGLRGRIIGPVTAEDVAAVVEDTTTTGGSMAEAVEVLQASGIVVAQAITVVDRSGGAAATRLGELGIPLTALVIPADLGVV